MPDEQKPGITPEDKTTPAATPAPEDKASPEKTSPAAPDSTPAEKGADEKINMDELTYDPDRAPEQRDTTAEDAEHARKMKEMFGDLDEDEDGAPVVDTVESLREELAELQEKSEASAGALSRAHRANAELVQLVEEGKQSIAGVEKKAKDAQKYAITEMIKEMQPVLDGMAQNLAAIDPAARAEDPKFAKFAEGVEKTLGLMSAVFNKFAPAPKAPDENAPKPADAAPAAEADKPAAPEAPKAEDAKPAENQPPANEAPKADAAPKAPDTVESLRAEINQAQEKFAAAASDVAHAQGENQILRRRLEDGKQYLARIEAQGQDDQQFAVEKLVKQMLPPIDTLELGLGAIPAKARAEDPKFAKFAETVETTLTQLTAVFNKFGVQSINPVNQPFDENKHEAILQQEKEGAAPETVVQVAQKGYELNGRVIRHAKVIVTPPA